MKSSTVLYPSHDVVLKALNFEVKKRHRIHSIIQWVEWSTCNVVVKRKSLLKGLCQNNPDAFKSISGVFSLHQSVNFTTGL